MTPKEKRRYRLRIFANLEETGPIARVEDQRGKPAPLEETVALFHQCGFEPISARDWAYACIQLGIASNMCQKPSMLRDGIVHIPNPEKNPEGIASLVRSTPILEHPEYAARSHEAQVEFAIKRELESIYLQKIGSNDKSVIKTPGFEFIKTKYFGANKLMRYFFEDQVEDLGFFFDRNEIPSATIISGEGDHKKEKRAYIRNLWYGGVPGKHAIFSLCQKVYDQPHILIWGTKIPDKTRK